VTKSLPSYDEALKRTALDTNLSRAPSKIVLADCPVHGNNIQQQMNQGGVKINVSASTPSLPLNGQQQKMLNNATPPQSQPQQLTKPNLIISNAPKQYFKPHDLNSLAPPQIIRYNSATPTNLNGVERIFSGNRANKIPTPQQNGVYLQQNIKPAAPPPPPPPPQQQQQQQSVTPLELFQQSSIPIPPISNSNPSGTSTPRNVTSRPTSSVGIIPPPPVEFNNDEINRQPKQQTWKATLVSNSNSQTNNEHTLTKTVLSNNNNNNDIDKINSNINNTLNKHINEDILQLQARDAYSITGSSNGSSEYQPNNQQNNQTNSQQTTLNFKNQVSPAPIIKPQPQQHHPLAVPKSPSPQPQLINKTQPIMVQQQKQQANGRTITPTLLNANLAFIEEDDSTNKLNKNINTNDLQSSESYNERDFRRKGIDGDDIDDESSTLSTSSSVQPRIKQRPLKNHPSTNEKSKVLLKSVKTLESDYGRVLANGSVNNNQNKQNVNNLPGTISNSGNNSGAKPVVNGVAGRPPCRLNFYDKDSDTNTNSEISPMLAHGGLANYNGVQFIGNAIIGISKTYPALMKGCEII
jgi:hypothetical protein